MKLLAPMLSVLMCVSLGCRKRTFSGAKGGGAAAPVSSGSAPIKYASWGYKETRPDQFDWGTDTATPKALGKLAFSPITHCDLMVWAAAENPYLSVDVNEVVKDYRAARSASTGGYVSYEDFPEKTSNFKKKMSYQEGLKLVASFLAYTNDKDKDEQEFIQDIWVQVILDFGNGFTKGVSKSFDAATADSMKKTAGTGPSSEFRTETKDECFSYLKGIKSSTWGCMQHMAADYVSHLAATKKYALDAKNRDSDQTAYQSEIVKKDYAKIFPFFGIVSALPDAAAKTGPAGVLAVKTRRYEMPTVSYRTMKALSGHWEDLGKQAQLQSVAQKAACYFAKNKVMDSRVTSAEKWKGYWENDEDGKPAISYCSFDDGFRESGLKDVKECDSLGIKEMELGL